MLYLTDSRNSGRRNVCVVTVASFAVTVVYIFALVDRRQREMHQKHFTHVRKMHR